jgi:hypothetical protein
MDFSKVKFRASSWGNLMAEPQSKADKDAGRLGVTCQKELIKIYNWHKYGRKPKDVRTNAMDKGILLQSKGIELYSILEGEIYQENDINLENECFTGKPDMFLGETIQTAEKVDDLKNSYELETFIPKMIESVDKGYEYQLNVYYDLTGAQQGGLVYTLLSAPDTVLYDEHQYLLRNGKYISEESPDFRLAWAEREKELVFEDIDARERCIKVCVPRNDELIEKMKAKVPIFRQWLEDFHKKHINIYPK